MTNATARKEFWGTRDDFGRVTLEDAWRSRPVAPLVTGSSETWTQRVERLVAEAAHPPTPQRLPASLVFAAASEIEGITLAMMASTNQHKKVVHARVTTVGVLRALTDCTYPEIARRMGRRCPANTYDQHTRWLSRPEGDRVATVASVWAAAESLRRENQ